MLARNSYLDRMADRLGALETEIGALSTTAGHDDTAEHQLRDVQASLAAAKERLQALRRAGAELTDEMTQSFTQSFERLQTSVGRLRTSLDGRSHAA